MIYHDILKLFLEHQTYDRYKDALDYNFVKDNYPELYRLFRTLDIHYAEHPGDLTVGELEAAFYVKYPGIDKGPYARLFSSLAEGAGEVPKEKVKEVLSTLKQHTQASKLGLLALEVAGGRRKPEELTAFLEKFDKVEAIQEGADIEFVTSDINSLIESTYTEGGLEWRTESLNKSLGPLRVGDLGAIFARPETGKTSFLCSEVSWMAEQLKDDDVILHLNNEEQGEKVMLRYYEASLGVPLERILADKKAAHAEFIRRTGNRIKLVDNANTSKSDVESLCKRYKPRLIVFDQLDKIKGFSDDREDLLLGKIYQWAREIAKSYCPFIGVCQASAEADGVKYINMSHMANARTAKQAECDWILGIGLNFSDPSFVRGFSISKNKLLGGPKSDPNLRHGRFEVILDAELGRYRDIHDGTIA